MANFDDQNSTTQIKVISQCYVRPKYEVEASKQPYYLGPMDLLFLVHDPIQKGLLFSNKPENIQSDFILKLKDSLEMSLVHFYPLAGRFSTQKSPDDDTQWVYLDCTKGPGAQLIHATVDCTVSSILSSVDAPPTVRSFFDLGEKSINYDGHNRPLLSIQVTELIDGIFVGFSMNHSVVDGTSQSNFIVSLNEVFQQLAKTHGNNHDKNNNAVSISRKPVFKTYFPDGWGPIIKLRNIDGIKSMNKSINPTVLRERIFHFSSKSIQTLKAKANEECGGIHNISSFQALSALMWRSITRARNLDRELETCLGLLMDVRPRLSPPLSNNHFGALMMTQRALCNVGDLLDKGLGWAAMSVNQIVVSKNSDDVREFFEGAAKFLTKGPGVARDEGKASPLYTPNLVVIGGSARFDMYGPEFGLGKAEAVLAGYSLKQDGKISANPAREGGGSIDLEVCLKPEIMNLLELDEDFMSFVKII